MTGMVEVINAGIANSIQDAGRFGYRHMGITVSGCLDTVLARCANVLAGNGRDCACVEIRAMGPTLQVRHGRVRMALAGEISATLERADGSTREVAAWQSFSLDPEDILEIGSLPEGGVAYLALSGGIQTPLQLGSRSTYQRALIGGVDGHLLMQGNMLPCLAERRRELREYRAEAWTTPEGPIRVILGPQEGHFKKESLARFLSEAYEVTPQMDRMGVRLEGPQLLHITAEAADIVSDGVTPGVIQVPGNGQPIILLADCQTVGGYPKIATVIAADLPRLGQLRPKQKIFFQAVSLPEAKQALLDLENRWKAWAQRVVFAFPDTDAVASLPAGWSLSDW